MHPTLSAVLFVISLLWLPHCLYGVFKGWISTFMLNKTRRIQEQQSHDFPRQKVALIVAAKGVSTTFDRFLELILHQDYGEDRYRVIFVTEAEDDPARTAMDAYLQSPKTPVNVEVNLVVAGLAEDEGQKVHNQLAAFQQLRDDDEIIAFADADIADSENWLRRLVTPLNADTADATTGYRWFVPETKSLSNLLAVNINAALGILAGPRWKTILWGGSMALTRPAFDDLNVPKLLSGSLNDDVQITHYARQRPRKRLTFIRSLMPATPVSYTWASFWEFARRQYFQVRVYSPKFWFVGFFFTTTYLIGWFTTLLLCGIGDPRGWIVLAAGVGMNLSRFILRTFYLRAQFPVEIRSQLREARIFELLASSLSFIPHWLVIVSTIGMKEIVWAGVRYRVKDRQS
ncbi:MAG: glycosyltransferase family 2 protein, partial [Verrucomicrobiota bacterium]